MSVRLIALDLDDTLLRSDLTISEGNREAVRRAEEEGIPVVLASGRAREALARYVTDLGMDERPGYLICDNGASVETSDTGETIVKHFFPPATARKALAAAGEFGLAAEIYENGSILTTFDNEYSRLDSRLTGLPLRVAESGHALLRVRISKFVVPGEPAVLKKILPILRSRLGKNANILLSKPYFLEILPRDADKGTALRLLAGRLGIRPEEILAVGDGMNDEGMVSFAGYGVAMRNGTPDLKAKARWITRKTNEEDGVAEAIVRFALSGAVETRFCPPDPVEDAAAALRRGQLAVFPTETVYGLGANAFDPQACAAVFATKGRPGDNPLIVHVTSTEQAKACAPRLSPAAEALFAAFSPGPLTLILEKSPSLPDSATAGRNTVGIRIPSHPLARRLIELAGIPIAAPSANVSGEPSPTGFRMASLAMDGLVQYIIDGGECSIGLESTIVDATGKTLRILRPGSVTREMIESVLPAGYELSPEEAPVVSPDRPHAPGMKYAHYKPRAAVYLAESVDAEILDEKFADQEIGILLIAPAADALRGIELRSTGWHVQAYADAESYARNLFKCFAFFDTLECAAIIAEYPPAAGIGEALRNRLFKAAGGNFL